MILSDKCQNGLSILSSQVVILIVLTLSHQQCGALILPPEIDANELDSMLTQIMDCHSLASVGMSIVFADQIIYENAQGYSDIGRKIVFDAEKSLISIASLSKAFTSTLIGKLENRYGYDSKTTISSLLSKKNLSFSLVNNMITKMANLDDLLSHRIGCPRNDMAWLAEGYNKAQLIRRSAYFKTKSKFRASLTYSNLMYNLAGQIIEQLTGAQSFAALMHDHILGPLGMNNSIVSGEQKPNEENILNKAYFSINGTLIELSDAVLRAVRNAEGSAGIYLTLRNMSKWLRLLTSTSSFMNAHTKPPKDSLQEAVLATTVPLNSYILQLLAEIPEFKLNFDSIDDKLYATTTYESYAKGWIRQYYRGHLILSHGGSLFSVQSTIYWIPSKQVALFFNLNAIMTKSNAYFLNLVTLFPLTVIDRILGSQPWLTPDNVCHIFNNTSPASNSNSVRAFSPQFNQTTSWNNTAVPLGVVNKQFIIQNLSDAELQLYTGTYYSPIMNFLNITYDKQLKTLMASYGKHWQASLSRVDPKCNADNLLQFYMSLNSGKYPQSSSTTGYWVGFRGVTINKFWFTSINSRIDSNGVLNVATNNNFCDAILHVNTGSFFDEPKVDCFIIGSILEYGTPLEFVKTSANGLVQYPDTRYQEECKNRSHLLAPNAIVILLLLDIFYLFLRL